MADKQLLQIRQVWEEPSTFNRLPIVIIGGGGIAQQAHIPSYIKHSYPIAAVCDLSLNQLRKCENILKEYKQTNYKGAIEYFTNIASLLSFIKVNKLRVIFDIATRPLTYSQILLSLPTKSIILLQKPFGYDLNSAKQLVQIITKKQFVFATNFQLRFSSIIQYIHNALESKRSLFGDLTDVELNLKHVIPWHEWPWLKRYKDTELTFHSVHYLDSLQYIFGVPDTVFADINNPNQMTVILNYSSTHLKYRNLKIRLHIDHCCKYQTHNASLNVNGTKGAMIGHFSSVLNELAGAQNTIKDTMTVKTEGNKDVDIDLKNAWFIGSFYGPMANLQRFVNGKDTVLCTNVKSCYQSALLVHALILSHKKGAVIHMESMYKKHKISSFVRSSQL